MSSPLPRTRRAKGCWPPKLTRVLAFSGTSARSISPSSARTGSEVPKPSPSGAQPATPPTATAEAGSIRARRRSEERRVGKEWRGRGGTEEGENEGREEDSEQQGGAR